MTSHISFVISGLLLVIIAIVVQSIPVEKIKETVQAPSVNNKQTVKQLLLKSVVAAKPSLLSPSTTTSPTTTVSQSSSSTSTTQQEKNDNKKKRNINDDDDDRFGGLLDSESDENDDVNSYQVPDLQVNKNNKKIEHILHAKIKETSAKIHDNADKPVDTDDSIVFSDVKMTPNELTDIVRRRRDVKLNSEKNQRRKRALSPYDFYDTNSLYDPYADLIEGRQYGRPVRSFAPLYWYPSVYERNIRAAVAPSVYESSGWPRLYSSSIVDNDESEEDPITIFNDDEDDDANEIVNDFKLNRYPILLQSTTNPFDNLQLQQRYAPDNLPIDEATEQNLNDDDEDDEDEDDSDDNDNEQYRLFSQKQRPYYNRYGSIDTYFE